MLVVEDEASYVDALEVGLSAEGFTVMAARTLHAARELLARTSVDLVLLDVMLPDGSGVDFCRELTASPTPVIMVSARSSELDVVLGLEIGAADYVTKPFRLRELVARMRVVLRRPPTGAEDAVRVGEIVVDVARRTVYRGAQVVELSRKEFDLLALLCANLGQVVTREVALDTLWWGVDLTDDRTLDTHVKRLRQKLERDPATPRHLVTVRGVGFRLDP
ncbi:MAG: response regulator transcription factor [Acidimicrobiales bacterium]